MTYGRTAGDFIILLGDSKKSGVRCVPVQVSPDNSLFAPTPTLHTVAMTGRLLLGP